MAFVLLCARLSFHFALLMRRCLEADDRAIASFAVVGWLGGQLGCDNPCHQNIIRPLASEDHTLTQMDERFLPDGRSQRDRMLAGDYYIADDPLLRRDSNRAANLVAAFNATRGDDQLGRDRILRKLFASVGEGTIIRPPIRCDYGFQTSIGARSFANWGLICLDVGKIEIGNDVQLGPNVQLLTATHPLEPSARLAKWESSRSIVIGNNVWLGGGVIVCPGVNIGCNTVVGAGAVVTRDLPANVLAVGNPARIVRPIED